MNDETEGNDAEQDAATEENAEAGQGGQGSEDVKLEEFENKETEGEGDDEELQRTAQDLEAVYDVPVSISAILGRTHMEVSELLRLDSGDVIELDRKVGEAIDIYVNNRLIARGEVVLVDEKLGITMTEIIKTERH